MPKNAAIPGQKAAFGGCRGAGLATRPGMREGSETDEPWGLSPDFAAWETVPDVVVVVRPLGGRAHQSEIDGARHAGVLVDATRRKRYLEHGRVRVLAY